jgi:CRISPR-associated protein Cas5t
MIALYVSVPIASFRKGFAREYWETEILPPPSTCYGFLLSLVGETIRTVHQGARVAPALIQRGNRKFPPEKSAVLRTLWRIKTRQSAMGAGSNARPDFQELLTGTEIIIWLDSSSESPDLPMSLEARVVQALQAPESINRFGGLSLGESTHLVDEVSILNPDLFDSSTIHAYLLNDQGRLSLPVWVDHVGAAGTRFVSGNLTPVSSDHTPALDKMPMIQPHGAIELTTNV